MENQSSGDQKVAVEVGGVAGSSCLSFTFYFDKILKSEDVRGKKNQGHMPLFKLPSIISCMTTI